MPIGGNGAQMLTINVGAKLQVLQSSVNDIQKILDKLEPNSSSFRKLSGIVNNIKNDMEKLQAQSSKGFISQSQFNQTEKAIDKLETALNRSKIIIDNLNFKDIKLTAEQQDTFKNFEKELENIKAQYQNVKNELKKNLLSDTDTQVTLVGIDKNILNKDLEDIEKTVRLRVNRIAGEVAVLNKAIASYQAALNAASGRNAFVEKVHQQGISTETVDKDIIDKYLNVSDGQITGFKRGMKEQFIKAITEAWSLDENTARLLANKSFTEMQKAFTGETTRERYLPGIDTSDIENSLKKAQDQASNLKQESTAINNIIQQFDDMHSENGKLTQAQKAMGDQVEQTTAKIDKERRAVVGNAQETNKNSASQNSAKEAFKQLRDELERTNAAFLKQQHQLQTFNSIKSAIVNFMGFNQILNITRNAVREAINHIKELDTTMNGIAIVTDMTTADLWKQIDAYSAMAQKFGVTIQGAYEVSKIYYQAGYETNDVLTLTNETLKLAKISGLDYATTTDYMMTAMRGFKLEMEDASRVVDVYSNLAAHTAVSQQELAEAMTKTASSMEGVGATFEDTSAMIATMVAVTRESANNIGSALKSIASRYGELTKNPATLVDEEGEALAFNKVDAALQSVGISMKTVDGQFRDFTEVIVELAEKWQTLDSVSQRYIATQFAGNRQQSRFLALVSNIDLLKQNMANAENSEDVGTLQALKALDSLESKINQVQVAYQQFYTTIGIESVWKTFLDGTKNVINTLNSLPKLFGKIPVAAIVVISNLLTAIKLLLTQALSTYSKIYQQVMSNAETDSSNGGKKAGNNWIDSFISIFRNRTPEVQQAIKNTIEGTVKQAQDSGKSGTITDSLTKKNSLIKTANGLNVLSAAFSTISLMMDKTTEKARQTSAGFMAIGSAAKIGGAAAMAVASQWPQAISMTLSGIIELISANDLFYENAEERLERLTEETENLNNEAKKARAEYNNLNTIVTKVNELKDARYESAEAAEEYQNAVNELADAFPSLITAFEDGNAVIDDVEAAEKLLAQKRRESAKATFDAAKSEAKRAQADIDVSKENLNSLSPANFLGVAEEAGSPRNLQRAKFLTGLGDFKQNNNGAISNDYMAKTLYYQGVLPENIKDEYFDEQSRFIGIYADFVKAIAEFNKGENEILNNFLEVESVDYDEEVLEGRIYLLNDKVKNLNSIDNLYSEDAFEIVTDILDYINEIQNNFGEENEYKDRLQQLQSQYEQWINEYQSISGKEAVANLSNKRLFTQWQEDRKNYAEEELAYYGSGLEKYVTEVLFKRYEGDFSKVQEQNITSEGAVIVAQKLYEAVSKRGEDALNTFLEALNDSRHYTGSDLLNILKDLGVTYDNEIQELLLSRDKDLASELTSLASNSKLGPDNKLIQEITTRINENKDVISEYERQFYAQAIAISEAYKKIGVVLDFTGLLDKIQSLPVELRDAILNNGFKTKEAIENSLSALENSNIPSELKESLKSQLQGIQSLINSNLSITIKATVDNFTSEIKDATSSVNKLTSGLEIQEALDLLNTEVAQGLGWDLNTFTVVNGKLVTTAEQAKDYWENYTAIMSGNITSWKGKLDQANALLSSIEGAEDVEETIRVSADFIREFIGDENYSNLFDESGNFIANGEEIQNLLETAINSIITDVEQANAVLNWTEAILLQSDQWANGDYSSLGLSGADLKKLASGEMTLSKDDAAKKSAKEKINSAYSSLISDVLSKGFDNININNYEGLINPKNIDLKGSYQDFVRKYANWAGKTIEETNSLIVQALEKENSTAAQDALKDVNFYTKDLAYASLDTIHKLADAMHVGIEEIQGKYNSELNQYEIQDVGYWASKITNSTDIFFDSINSTINSITKYINNGITGKLQNGDISTLNAQLNAYGVEALKSTDFTRTADGLKLSEQAAFRLYNELKDIDAIQADLTFNELSKSLQETNSHYKTTSDLLVRIKELNDKIIEANKTDVNKDRIEQYNQELKVAEEILRVRSTTDDNSFDFMSRSLPEGMQNPIDYWNATGKAYKAMNEASESGYMEIQDYYNIITEMANLIQMSSTEIEWAGMNAGNAAEQAAILIQKGIAALSNIDGEGVKVDMSKLGEIFSDGAASMAEGFDAGIKEMAGSQIRLLDALIMLLEGIVQMGEALDSVAGDDSVFQAEEIFEDGKMENGFKDAFDEARKTVQTALEGNEQLQPLLQQLKIENISLEDWLSLTAKQLQDLDVDADTVLKVFNALLKTFKSEDFDDDPTKAVQSMIQILSNLGINLDLLDETGKNVLEQYAKGLEWTVPKIEIDEKEFNKSKETTLKKLQNLYKEIKNGTGDWSEFKATAKGAGIDIKFDIDEELTIGQAKAIEAALELDGESAAEEMKAAGESISTNITDAFTSAITQLKDAIIEAFQEGMSGNKKSVEKNYADSFDDTRTASSTLLAKGASSKELPSKEVMSLTAQVQKLQASAEQSTAEAKAAIAEANAAIEAARAEAQAQIDGIKAETEATITAVKKQAEEEAGKAWYDTVQEKENEISDLTERLNKVSAEAQDAAAKAAQASQDAAILLGTTKAQAAQEMSATANKFEAELSEAQSTIGELREALAQLEKDAQEAIGDAEKKANELAVTSEERVVHQANEAIAAAQLAFDLQSASLTTEIASLNTNIDELIGQKDRLEREKKQLESDLEVAREEADAAKGAVAKAESERDAAKAELKTREETIASLEEANADLLSTGQAEIAKAEEAAKEARKRADKAAQQRADAEKQLAAKEAIITSKEADIQEKFKQIADLQSTLNDVEKQGEEALADQEKKYKEIIDGLKEKIKTLEHAQTQAILEDPQYNWAPSYQGGARVEQPSSTEAAEKTAAAAEDIKVSAYDFLMGIQENKILLGQLYSIFQKNGSTVNGNNAYTALQAYWKNGGLDQIDETELVNRIQEAFKSLGIEIEIEPITNAVTFKAQVAELKEEAEEPVEVPVGSDTASAAAEVTGLVSSINNTIATMKVTANTSLAESKVAALKKSIANTTASVSVTAKTIIDTGNSGSPAKEQSRPTAAIAKGNVALAAGHRTLMGELGPELYVTGGHYYVAGRGGAEFVNLPDDAIVFNHLQTQRLLASGASGRGTPVTNERKAASLATGNAIGPAKASAQAALAALKQLRAMWDALLHAGLSDLGSKAGLGKKTGGGGGGKDDDKGQTVKLDPGYIRDLERWYNLLRKIERLEQDINYEERLRSKLQSDTVARGKEIYESYRNSYAMMQEELNYRTELASLKKGYYEQRIEEMQTGPWSQIFTFDEKGTPQMKNLAFLSNVFAASPEGGAVHSAREQYALLQEAGFGDLMKYKEDGSIIEWVDDEGNAREEAYKEAVEAFSAKLDSQTEEVNQLYEEYIEEMGTIADLQAKQNEILNQIRDNTIEVQEEVLKALEEMKQTQIDNLQHERDAISDAADKFINGLTDQLNKERDMYNKQQDDKELRQMQRQLGILRRSGGSASQIQELENNIAQKEQDRYFDKQQEQIDAVKEASDLQIERLDAQISLMTETLEYQKKNGLLWGEVHDIMQGSSAEISNFITGNNSEWWNKSSEQYARDLVQLDNKIGQFVAHRDDVTELGKNITTAITNGIATISEVVGQISTDVNVTVSGEGSYSYSTGGGASGGGSYEGGGESGAGSTGTGGGSGSGGTGRTSGSLGTLRNPSELGVSGQQIEGQQNTTGTLKLHYKCGIDTIKPSETKNITAGASVVYSQFGPPTIPGYTFDKASPSNTFKVNGGETKEITYNYKADTSKRWHVEGLSGSFKTQDEAQKKREEWYKEAYKKYTDLKAKGDPSAQEWYGKAQERKSAKIKYYKYGGIINYTGPAWVDGTKSRPEGILNAEQLDMLRNSVLTKKNPLMDLLSDHNNVLNNMANANTYNTINSGESMNIEKLELNMNISKLANDYDARSAANSVMEEIVRISKKGRTVGVSRR